VIILFVSRKMRTARTSECSLCDGTGWRPVAKQDNGTTYRAVQPCSCQTAPRSLDWWMDQAQIPARFRGCTFDDFFVPSDNSSLQMALVKARGFTSQYPLVEKGLLLIGNPGVGKTHLTVAILKELMAQKGTQSLFCSFPELLERLQESYDPVSLRTKSEILEPVLETEVVAIDDLGARRVSDWVEDTVTYILNYRYNEKKPTLLTSNLPDGSAEASGSRSPSGKFRLADTLVDRVGVRIYSRLFEMCEKVVIHAPDFRQEVRVHEQSARRRAR
jgi:DNA replication protein DnaC